MGNVSTKEGHKRLKEEPGIYDLPQVKEEAGISDLPLEKEKQTGGDSNVPCFDPSFYDNHQDQVPNKASLESKRGYHVTPDYSYVNLSDSSSDGFSENGSPSSDNKNKVNIWCEIGANKQDQDYQSGSDSSPSEGSGERRLQFKMDKEPKNAQVFQKNHGNVQSKTQEKQVLKENTPGQ